MSAVVSIRPDVERFCHIVHNQDALMVAIRRLGGRLLLVDVEDIALEAASILPGRFGWSRHPGHIDLEKVRASIRCLARKDGDEYVVGGTKEGWMLTPMGLAETESMRGLLGEVVPPSEPEMLRAERARLIGHELVAYLDGREPPKEVVQDFFRPWLYPGKVSAPVARTRILNVPALPGDVLRTVAKFSRLI